VAAYRGLIEDLAPRMGVRREPGETPAEHAGRLRRAGVGALGLDLLAADYGLARFAGRELSEREEQRAIGRAAMLRRRLRPLPPPTPVIPSAQAGARRTPEPVPYLAPEVTDEAARPVPPSIGRTG
jgi:hypothetical protein